jgi:hypothetical protein
MTASPYFFVLMSSITMSRMKFEGRDSKGEFPADSSDLDEVELVVLILLTFYMGKVNSRRLLTASHMIICVQKHGGLL